MTEYVLPGQAAGPPGADPTAVMGRRIVAWLLDLALFVAFVIAVFAVLAESVDVPETFVLDPCDVLEAEEPEEASGCVDLDGQVYITSDADNGIQLLASLGYFAVFVVLQGVTGGSPGKLLTGVRVVDEQGRTAGVGRSLGRTLLWVVDGAPWLVPLVGFITGLTSTGHRRVGDMVARTYVVARDAVGTPPQPPGVAPPATLPGQWAPPPPTTLSSTGTFAPSPWPAAPPGEPEADPREADVDPGEVEAIVSEAAPRPGPTVAPDESPDPDAGAPAGADPSWWEGPEAPAADDPIDEWQPPTTPGEDFTTATDERSPTAGPTPFVAPGSEAPPPVAPPVAEPPAELPPPQWDEARGTYIQWDPRRQQWLQWDATTSRWHEIEA